MREQVRGEGRQVTVQRDQTPKPRITNFHYSSEELSLVVPKEYGGVGASKEDLLDFQIELARQNLSRAFVFGQRNAAIGWIAHSKDSPLRDDLLERATTEYLATQAVSVIAPSARGRDPLVKVREEADGGLSLSGVYPWVSGLTHAQFIVGGAESKGGSQYLVLLNCDEPSAKRTEYQALHALSDSDSFRYEAAELPISQDRILLGPSKDLVTLGKGGTLKAYPPLATTALALGHASKLCDLLIRAVASHPGADTEAAELLCLETERLKQHMKFLVHEKPSTQAPFEAIRAQSNLIVTALSQMLLLETRGKGFVLGTEEEQALREADFFQIWANSKGVEDSMKERILTLIQRESRGEPQRPLREQQGFET